MMTLLRAGLIAQLALCAATAQAQTGEAGSTAIQLAALKAALDDLQKQVEAQRRVIAGHTLEIESQRQTIDRFRQQFERNPPAKAASYQIAEAGGPAAEPPLEAQTTAQPPAPAEQPVRRAPDLPQTVTPGDFPGSIDLPGTDTAFKIGGQARATLIHSLRPIGEDDRFITSSIPVDTQSAGDDARAVYTASPSRINFDVRTPTPFGGLRTFVEYRLLG